MLLITSAIILLIAGGVAAFLIWGKKEPPPPPPEPIVDKPLTVGELKEKYSYKDNKISPLYNVSSKEQFKISFNSYLGDIPASEIITVHTHDGLGTSSTVDTELVAETHDVGPSTFTIKPKESVLNKRENSWGKHHMYYIKINYDMDTNTPTRLEQPLVIPFTLKGSAENVDALPIITDKGEFKLTWKPFEKDSTSVQVYNVIKGASTKFESDKTPVEENAFVSTYTRNIGGSSGGVYTDWLSKSATTGLAKVPSSPTSTLNNGLKGAYYLQNINGDTSSVVSNIVNVSEYANRIPMQLVTPLGGSTHDTIRSLPKTVEVQMLDGSITDQFVHYKTDGVEVKEGKPTTINFSIANTTYMGELSVTTMKQEELEIVKQGELVNLSASYNKPINLTTKKPSVTLPTLISDAKIVVEEQKEADAAKETEVEGKEEKPSNETDTNPKSEEGTPVEENKATEDTSKTPADGSLGLGGTVVEGDGTGELEVDPTAEMGIINKQYYYNQQALETANEQTITIPAYLQEAKYEMTHASALEEFLAYSILAGQTNISLDAFPDAQTYSVVSDVVDKVLTQNPLLNNVAEWKYDYLTRSITLTYNTSFSPSDVLSKAHSILEELTMVDAVLTEKEIKDGVEPYKVKKEMSNEELYQAIYNYLVDNVKLTTVEEAKVKAEELEKAKSETTSNTDETKEVPKEEEKVVEEPKDKEEEKATGTEEEPVVPQLLGKPTAYNALVEGLADDLGFAKAFKLLMDVSGVPAIVTTGYYQGEPHAWNKIALNDAWYNVDTTLNMYTLGIPNALSLTTDDTTRLLGYIEDKGYWTDQHLSTFSATSGLLDHYVANGLEVDTVADYAKVLENKLVEGNRVTVIRTRLELDPKLIFDTTGLVVQQTVPDKLATASFNSKGKYYIIITHEEEEVVEEDEVEPSEVPPTEGTDENTDGTTQEEQPVEDKQGEVAPTEDAKETTEQSSNE